MNYREYILPETLEEAWTLNQNRNNHILAGNLWLRSRRRTFGTAIDLSRVVSDAVEETADVFRIGAMTTLHTLETHDGLNRLTQNAFRDALCGIIGVQFRNSATAGGSLWGRFGFSGLLTLLLPLDARVVLYRGGTVPLTDYASAAQDRDLLLAVELPKEPVRVRYQSLRLSQTVFPILLCAVAEKADGRIAAAVGARPGRAVRVDKMSDESCAAFAERVCREVPFGSNALAGAEYRRHLAGVFLRRGLDAINKMEEKGGAR